VDDTTITQVAGFSLGPAQDANADVWALVIAWCPDEPQRLGEVFLLPEDKPLRTYVLGRGPAQHDDPGLRVLPARQRPGRQDVMAPLTTRAISRVQLRVTVTPHALSVENVGKMLLLHGEREVTRVAVKAGDTLQLGNHLLLLCVRRPGKLVGEPPDEGAHPFGQADDHGMVGESAAAWQLRRSVDVIAAREGHVLVLGRSGTGKELVARSIHVRSARGKRALVARNAATIPEGIVDAELFGNAKNFPNPGMAERPGLIGQADRSTLFLDEFAELPVPLQAHLLRVLDAGEYHRLGEATARRSDFRLLAATNRPESALKHDVLARFSFQVDLPDLNARREDIPLLVRHQMQRLRRKDPDVECEFFERGNAPEPKLPCSLLRALLTHTYTSNVRELSTLVWSALVKHIDGSAPLSEERKFDFRSRVPSVVPPSLEPTSRDSARPSSVPPSSPPSSPPPSTPSTPPPPEPEAVNDEDALVTGKLTPQQLQECLDRNNGVVSLAARELGLSSRYALHRLIRKYGLEIRKRSSPPR
jgi:two-component system nitrogen regulation response regulator GlnG/two-component system response regulator HydG